MKPFARYPPSLVEKSAPTIPFRVFLYLDTAPDARRWHTRSCAAVSPPLKGCADCTLIGAMICLGRPRSSTGALKLFKNVSKFTGILNRRDCVGIWSGGGGSDFGGETGRRMFDLSGSRGFLKVVKTSGVLLTGCVKSSL